MRSAYASERIQPDPDAEPPGPELLGIVRKVYASNDWSQPLTRSEARSVWVDGDGKTDDELDEWRFRFRAPFFDVVRWVQIEPVDQWEALAAEQKGEALTDNERADLMEHADDALRFVCGGFGIGDEVLWIHPNTPVGPLDDEQRAFLGRLPVAVQTPDEWMASIRAALHGLPAKRGYQAIYQALLGQNHGPNAGKLLACQNLGVLTLRLLLASQPVK